MIEGNWRRVELFVNTFLIVFEFMSGLDSTGDRTSFVDFLFDLGQVIGRDFVIGSDVDKFRWWDRGALAIVATFVTGLTVGGLTFVEVTGLGWNTVFEGVLIDMQFVSTIATVLVRIAVEYMLDREKGREGVFIFVDVVTVCNTRSGRHGPAAAA